MATAVPVDEHGQCDDADDNFDQHEDSDEHEDSDAYISDTDAAEDSGTESCAVSFEALR